MREKLIELICQAQDCGCDVTDVVEMNYVENDALADHLIANGVTIPVRCKDCKHCTVTSDGMVCENALPTKRMTDYYIFDSMILAKVGADDFCSYGERRTDETSR